MFNNFEVKDTGHLFENVVFNHLLSARQNVCALTINIHERNKNNIYVRKNLEVVFVYEKLGKICYLQCCWTVNDELILQRELKPFRYIKDNLDKALISIDRNIYNRDFNGYYFYNGYDFLLDKIEI